MSDSAESRILVAMQRHLDETVKLADRLKETVDALQLLDHQLRALEHRVIQIETWVSSTRQAVDTLGSQFDHHVHAQSTLNEEGYSLRTAGPEWHQ